VEHYLATRQSREGLGRPDPLIALARHELYERRGDQPLPGLWVGRFLDLSDAAVDLFTRQKLGFLARHRQRTVDQLSTACFEFDGRPFCFGLEPFSIAGRSGSRTHGAFWMDETRSLASVLRDSIVAARLSDY